MIERLETIATTINLPIEDFTFYKQPSTNTFELLIDYKHFNTWINFSLIEEKLYNLGHFIANNDSCYSSDFTITVAFRGNEHVLILYEYQCHNASLIASMGLPLLLAN